MELAQAIAAAGTSIKRPQTPDSDASINPVGKAFLGRRRYDMGMGVFSNPDGCGRGEGIVHLRITYTPFTMFQRHPADSITVRAAVATLNPRV